MKSKTPLVVLLVLAVLVGVGYWVRSLFVVPQIFVADETDQQQEASVEEDWVKIAVPQVIEESRYTMTMELTQPFQDIDVIWRHPSNIESDVHTLTEFVPGTSQAEYTVSTAFGNLLPGVNTYEIFAREDDEEPGEGLSTTITMEYSFDAWEEEQPELLSFSNFFETLDTQEYELTGTVGPGVERIEVTSFHPESGKATYAKLRKFQVGDEFFRYVMGEQLGNLFYGENSYVLEAYGAEDALLSRKRFDIRSDYLSLLAQVQQTFGNFSKNEQGWYRSEKLPWFFLRPVFEEFSFEPNDQSVVMPRPTLMYPLMASPETRLCQFLGNIDYEEDNYSYRGYSYETCQQYRFGVIVYDRFLSHLTFSPLEVVKRVEYDSIRDRASSAFVMIENGALPDDRREDLSFEDLELKVDPEEAEGSEEESAEEDAQVAEDEEEAPRSYMFQMLITEEVEYSDKKIGDIKDEASEALLAEFETVRTLLTSHGGDALFTELLFTGANAVDPISREDEDSDEE